MKSPVPKRRFLRAALPLAFALSTAAHAAKPAITGLIFMGSQTFHLRGGNPDNALDALGETPGVFSAVVINVTWAQLQPGPEAPLDTAAIDAALAALRDHNRRAPRAPLSAKLRVWPGIHAPDWAKSIAGPKLPVFHRNPRPGGPPIPVTIGRFWTGPYRAAWARLQSALAARYDAEPLIREVTNTACSTISEEPFNLPVDSASIAVLRGAGLTDAAYTDCLAGAIGEMAPWQQTRVEFPVNPFRSTDHGLAFGEAVTDRVIAAFRHRFGHRATIANYSINEAPIPRLVTLYDTFREIGPVIELQTDRPRAPDAPAWQTILETAIAMGASAVELWPGTAPGNILTLLPPAGLAAYARRLGKNLPAGF